MNVLNAVGNVGRVDLVSLKSGDKALKFSLAINTGYGDNKATTWWNATVFGKRAESLAQYIKKGVQIGVTGEPSLREYTDKEDVKRTSLDLLVTDVTLLSSVDRKDQEPTKVTFEDAIPF
jgi:single-strand DNA-binding protein